MESRIGRRSLLAAALLAPLDCPVMAQERALPTFSQRGQSFVFLSPVRMAPDVTLPLTDGRQVRLLEPGLRQASILYFGASWCPPCRVELAEIEARVQKPGPHPRVVAILMDAGGAGAVTPFLRRNGLKRPVALDPHQSLGSLTAQAQPGDPFVLWALPVSFVLSPDGHIIGYLPGAIDWTTADAARFLRAVSA